MLLLLLFNGPSKLASSGASRLTMFFLELKHDIGLIVLNMRVKMVAKVMEWNNIIITEFQIDFEWKNSLLFILGETSVQMFQKIDNIGRYEECEDREVGKGNLH